MPICCIHRLLTRSSWSTCVCTIDPSYKLAGRLSCRTLLVNLCDALPTCRQPTHDEKEILDTPISLVDPLIDIIRRDDFVGLCCNTAHTCPDMIVMDRHDDSAENILEKETPGTLVPEQEQRVVKGVSESAGLCCVQAVLTRERVEESPRTYYKGRLLQGETAVSDGD